MKKYALLRYCLVFLAIVLPYFTAAAFHGTEMVLAERKPDMEEYLPYPRFFTDFPGYEKRNHKSADCDRTVEYSEADRGGKNLAEILWENRNTGEVWRYFFTEKNQIYQQSAKETGGKVLTYEGKVKLTPWHKISAGKTRSGAEAFHDEAYTYLKSADSSGGQKSPDYMKVVEIPAGQFSGELKIKSGIVPVM